MKRFLLVHIITLLSLTGLSQTFGWREDGYVNRSGGGYYENIDGSGISLYVSGLVNDMHLRRGCIRTGVDDGAPGAIVHKYVFIFSEKVDIKFSVMDINGGPGQCGFIDHVGFSGDPIFSSPRQVEIIDDSLVIPAGFGSVMVEYYGVDTVIIYHGEGVKCNPGFIGISGFSINQNVIRMNLNEKEPPEIGANLLFDTDKSDLTDEHKAQLVEVLEHLTNDPTRKIKIAGFTDSVGDSSYNVRLSERRVGSLHRYLLNMGVLSDQIQVVFYGEENPEASNESEEGRQLNRRVEIELLD